MLYRFTSTHHLMFAEDASDTLWTSGGRQVAGWLDVKQFLETGDAAASQGWTPFILYTNGNGVRDADYVEPDDAVDPTKDKLFGFSKIKEQRLVDRIQTLVKGVCKHWSDPKDLVEAMLELEFANKFLCERFQCTHLDQLDPITLLTKILEVSSGS